MEACDAEEKLLQRSCLDRKTYSSVDGLGVVRKTSQLVTARRGVVLALAVVGVMAVVRHGSSGGSSAASLVEESHASSSFAEAFPSDGAGVELTWAVTNSYTKKLGKAIGSQYPWVTDKVQVIDPYRTATLSVTNVEDVEAAFPDKAAGDWHYAWTLGCSDGSTHALEGAHAVVYLEGTQDCTVGVELKAAGKAVTSGAGLLKVRYVRREVRELDAADRDLWLDSLYKMWSHTGEAGRKLFGASFISSDELLAIHATNSALRDNDHFHNGAGFLAQHVRLDTMVLKSLQAIDPSISTPYWDWTIESRMVETGDISSPFETPLWTADWFGSLNFVEDPQVLGPHYGVSLDEFLERGFEAWAIRDGRWKYAKVKRLTGADTKGYPVNSYGYLRSPWNNNPSPYVTRINFPYDPASLGKSWPTCTDLHTFIEPQDVSAVYFMTHLEDMTVHANVHQALGGTAMDVNSTQKLLDMGQSCYQTVVERHLWRAHLLDMQPSCDPDLATTPDAVRNCQLSCDAEAPDRIIKVGQFFLDHYSCVAPSKPPAPAKAGAANAGKGDMAVEEDVVEWTDEELLELGKAACGLTFIKGEHLEASGTTDPSFFLVHPTLARYYQFKQLMGPDALVDDWASVDSSNEACIPAIEQCYSGFNEVEDAEDCCAGHFRYSRFFAGTYGKEPSEGLDGEFILTNEQIMVRADAFNSDESALIFHHLDFDHCEEDFSELLAPTTSWDAATGGGDGAAPDVSAPPAAAASAAMMN
ncbi:hypothetical protein M885DRAFT_458851 [Pelagophyceae sp. CCMP2097]|nr:hypothetical protein M885DRAFT_458851 [Pelagophyceae sp. CCMP2097]